MRRDYSKAIKPDVSGDPAGGSGSAGLHYGHLTIALILATTGCLADLLSKRVVFERLGMPGPQASPHWIVPEYFGFETSINTGGLFGMFSGNPLPLAIISLIAIVGILWWMTLGGASHDRFLSIILGLILGGILGNLYDRLGLWGIRGVRDWILFKYRDHVWPNFNIADMLLVCGAGLMMFQAYRADVADRRSRQGATSHAGDSSAESDFGSGATDTSTATSDTTENPPTDELTASS